MKKLLVTGASGFLGWNLCQIARQDWQVYGTYYRHPFNLSGVSPVKLELGDKTTLKAVFEDLKPDAVMHLAALSQPNLCQKSPQLSYQVNVVNTVNLGQQCVESQIPLVFTSTDLVFDGITPPYAETAPVNPVNLYGEHKVKAEQQLQAIHPQVIICRMPLMFGLSSPHYHSFIQPFIEKLRGNQPLSLFQDEWRTPVSATTASQGLLLALETGTGGILHLGGKESISRYQFGCLLAEVLNLPTAQLTACSQVDVLMPAARPPDVSLDSRKAYALGYTPPKIREALITMQSAL